MENAVADVERVTETQWHDRWSLPVMVKEAGKQTEFTYNENGLLLTRLEKDSKTYSLGETKRNPGMSGETDNTNPGFHAVSSRLRQWSYQYNELSQLILEDGPRTDVADIIRYAYDEPGNRISVINAANEELKVTDYTVDGLPLEVQQPNGLVSRLSYNSQGWLIAKTDILDDGTEVTTRYEYRATTNYEGEPLMTAVILPNGNKLRYEYNGARKLRAIENPLGERIEYTLDEEGNRTAEIILDADGNIRKQQFFVYDQLNRLVSILNAEGRTMLTNTYNSAGNVESITDGRGYTTKQSFDALNRLVASVDPLAGVARFTYSDQDKLISVTDQRGLVTRYVYDGFGQLIEQDSPDTGVSVFAYNEAGQPIRKMDARGVIKEIAYDALGRVIAVTYPDNPEENITYAYEQGGRVVYRQDPTGETRTEHNVLGQVVREAYSVNGEYFETAYEYDVLGQLTALHYPGGEVVRYYRDDVGRVEKVTAQLTDDGDEQLVVNDLAYLPFGPMRGMRYGNDLVHRVNRDLDYRVQQIRTEGVGLALMDRHYAYDGNSNITSINDVVNANASESFHYDPLNRLTQAVGHYGHELASISYDYDGVGNRLSRHYESENTVWKEAYAYAEESNRLLSVARGDSVRGLQYDAVGNIVVDDQQNGSRQLVYNSANRLSVVDMEQAELGYQHNAEGQRVSRQVGDDLAVMHYGMDNQLIVDGDGEHKVLYIYLNGERVASVKSKSLLFSHNDHLMTAQLVTDGQQEIVWRDGGTPFGEMDIVVNDEEYTPRFPGQFEDVGSGYSYNYFRDYDASLGRYIQSDPIGLKGGVNTFGYVKSNPNIYFDQYGLDWQISVAIKSGAGAGVGFELSQNLVINFGSDGITYQESQTLGFGATTIDLSTVVEIGLHNMGGLCNFLGDGIDVGGNAGAGFVFGGNVHGTVPDDPANGNMDISGGSVEFGMGVSPTIVSGGIMSTYTVPLGEVQRFTFWGLFD